MDQEVKTTKVCSKCGVEKLLDEFSNYTESKDGKQSRCKSCAREYQKQQAELKRPERERKRLEKIALKQKEIEDRLLSGEKTCCECHEIKPFSEYYKDRSNLDGYRPNCKSCVGIYRDNNKEKTREYQRNNRDKQKVYYINYITKNADRLAKIKEETAEERKAYYRNYNKTAESRKIWAETHKEYNAIKAKEYRQIHGERLNENWRQYAKENKHIVNANSRKRYASKINACPPWADLEKIKQIYKDCADLTKETGIKHNVDHIVPLRSKLVCGLHCESNLQILTKFENVSKSNRHWPDMP